MGKSLFMLDENGNTIPAGTRSYLKYSTIILRSANWADQLQTVEVDGITADKATCHVAVNPDPVYFDTYCESGIRCTAQGEGMLTFFATEVPEVDVVIDLIIAR